MGCEGCNFCAMIEEYEKELKKSRSQNKKLKN